MIFTYCFVLDLTWFFGCESSDSVARTKLASRTLSATLRITGLKHKHNHTQVRIHSDIIFKHTTVQKLEVSKIILFYFICK